MENQYKLNTLRHWYLGEYEWNGEKILLVYGQFFNRPGIYEGMVGHTSTVQTVTINHEEKEFEIQTKKLCITVLLIHVSMKGRMTLLMTFRNMKQ